MSELLKLAERCEQATGTDALELINLECDICAAIGIDAGAHETPFTASIDAAMTLVPSEMLWHVNKWASGADASIASVRPYEPGPRCTAATPALALCAAALRARAASDSLLTSQGGE